MKQILLIEDDYALAMGTTYTLKAEGYEVGHAKNLAEARELLSTNNYSLILLDVMLPDGDGFSYLEELSQKGNATPVIFCTAVGDESNIVRGLDLGADDYVTKPYRVKELLSRIAAVLRRAERAMALNNNSNNSLTGSNVESIEADVTFGSHRFNIDSFRLYNNENIVDCTPAELRLLREFIRNKGIVITRNQLLQRLYDTENTYIDDNTLSVYIKRLRDKLGEDAEHIKTVKGIGYRFE
ncbi:MAG: response regulator transcription factor [Eubacterium sp.]|nr:response regulator transcription factor [Eubacterium sp.]